MHLLRSVLFFLCLVCWCNNLHAQPGLQFGLGYGVGYYYQGQDNLKAGFVEWNYIKKPWYTDKLQARDFSRGFRAELRGNKIGMLYNFTMYKTKYTAGGVDPVTNQQENLEMEHINWRGGIGFKNYINQVAVGGTFELGVAGQRYKISGNGSTRTDWEGFQSTLSYGSNLFAERFLSPRLGVRIEWYAMWLAMESYFEVADLKNRYSYFGASVFLYVARNYD